MFRSPTTDESTPPDIATTTRVSLGDLFIPREFIINCIYYKKISFSIMQFEFEPGDYVINPSKKEWGIGQIQSIVKSKITVNFENVGKQVINTELVKLEKVKND